MAHDNKLAERIRDIVSDIPRVKERRMFGGVCFMVNDYMACGVEKSNLVVRVGPGNYQRALARKHTRPMDFTGKPMTGYVYVSEGGFRRTADLRKWVSQGVDFVRTLPPKKPKTKPVIERKPKRKTT